MVIFNIHCVSSGSILMARKKTKFEEQVEAGQTQSREPIKPKKRSEAEVAQAQQEGNEFIQAREKRAGLLAGGRPVTKENIRQASAQVSAGEQARAEQIALAKQEQEVIQQGEEEARPPQDITAQDVPIVSKIPVIGNALGAIQSTINDLSRQGKIPLFKGEGIEVADLPPEIAREQALVEIENRIRKEGVSADAAFGALIESIPIVGNAATKYASGITTPSAAVKTNLGTITKNKERAMNIGEFVSGGRMSEAEATEELESISLHNFELESKMKYLIQISTELRGSPEQVENIMAEIERSNDRVADAQIKVGLGALTSPTDEQIFTTLQQ